MAISRNGLLITDKILDSGHGAEISILVLYSRSPTLTSKMLVSGKLSSNVLSPKASLSYSHRILLPVP